MNEEAKVVCAFCGLAPYKEFHGATRLHWTRNDCIAALRSALAEAKVNAGNFAVIQPGQSVADAVPTYEAMAAELAAAKVDADRYRYWRDGCVGNTSHIAKILARCAFTDDYDAAIDAARCTGSMKA